LPAVFHKPARVHLSHEDLHEDWRWQNTLSIYFDYLELFLMVHEHLEKCEVCRATVARIKNAPKLASG
jgi:hypothetical protein